MLQVRKLLAEGHADAAGQIVIDLQASLRDQGPDLRIRLAQLGEERICAAEDGLTEDRAYMGDLELETAQTTASTTVLSCSLWQSFEVACTVVGRYESRPRILDRA